MTTLQQLTSSQASPEVPLNENSETLSAAGLFGKRHPVTTGLTWGYYGGLYNGNTIADGTVTLTNAADNYVVVLRSTGVVSVSTSSTNSLDPLYAKLYKLTCAGSVVTATVDQRFDTNGLLFSGVGSGGIGDMLLAGVQTVTGAKTFGSAGAVGKLKVAGTTSGAITLDAAAVAGANTLTLPAETDTLATQGHVSTAVAAAVAGLSWKQAVRAATTGAGTLASDFENGDTIDGVVLATGDRILVKNQASGAENGIYVVAGSGAPARSSDADSGAELVNASVYVSEGTTLGDTQWTCTTNAPITPGSTSLAFAQLASGGGTITALTGDVTASGSGSVAATIANAAVTLAKMADLTQDQFIGRVTASTGVPETATITAAARTVLDDTTTGAMRTTLGLAIGSDVQAYDADLATIAGLTATTDNFIQSKSSAWASRTVAQVSADLQATGLVTDAVGFRTIPQNSQSTAYTTVAADAGKHLLHPSADTTARTFTIDSNANVAYPVGTAITFVNQNSAGVLTIAITSDTMRLAPGGTTGSRTLAANGVATALKVTSTEWIISGAGLT